MSLNLQEYWAEVREVEKALRAEHPDGCVYLTMLTDRKRLVQGGFVSVAAPGVAAKTIVDGTHRVATPGEIEGYVARQNIEARRSRAADQRLRGDRRYRVEL